MYLANSFCFDHEMGQFSRLDRFSLRFLIGKNTYHISFSESASNAVTNGRRDNAVNYPTLPRSGLLALVEGVASCFSVALFYPIQGHRERRLHRRFPLTGGSECPTPTGSTLGPHNRSTLLVAFKRRVRCGEHLTTNSDRSGSKPIELDGNNQRRRYIPALLHSLRSFRGGRGLSACYSAKDNIYMYSRNSSNGQMYEIFDDTSGQVILTLSPGDSIRQVARRIHAPYETVRQAVNTLEEAGFVQYDNGLYLTNQAVRETVRQLAAISACVCPPSIDEAYVIPQFSDVAFAYTRIDAVYVWTQGGYQVGRNPEDYPLFLIVRDRDIEQWERFFERFNLPVALSRQPIQEIEGPLQIVLEPRTDFDIEWVEGYPVIPRDETIEYMREHFAHFQSALAMLDRMYDDIDLDVEYCDRGVAQS
jgi:DNA-binding Lrp family transcriptional regulator